MTPAPGHGTGPGGAGSPVEMEHSGLPRRVAVAVERLGRPLVLRCPAPLLRHLLRILQSALAVLVVRIASATDIPAHSTIGPGRRRPHATGTVIDGAPHIGRLHRGAVRPPCPAHAGLREGRRDPGRPAPGRARPG